SIALNPLLFALVEPARRWIVARSALARRLEARDDPLAALPTTIDAKYLAQQVVLVGYGVVGRAIASALAARDIPLVVVEQSRERVGALRREGRMAVAGDAVEPIVLVQAHIAEAGLLVIAASESTDVRPMVATARALNPSIAIVARAANEEEARLLVADGIQRAIHARAALAEAMTAAAVAVMRPAG
ncbi:MAG TPA: NAD(P)-binding protein, partial [Burkholderiaceae bacterium]|nr:NAD(P)-binding protein [Burkholderiaceae bacterium]